MTSHCNDSTLKGVIKPHCNNFSYHLDAAERGDRRKMGGASCAYRDTRPGVTGQGTMVYSDELLAVAKRIFCFGTPEEALEFPIRFLTHAMTYASDEDIEILRKYFSDDEFEAALDDPAPPHLGFSTKAPGPSGINTTAVLQSHHFRSDGFRA